MWCVVEFGSNGDFFDPDYFETKEEATSFLKSDVNECCGCNYDMHSFAEFFEDFTSACVSIDDCKYFWRAFNIPTEE